MILRRLPIPTPGFHCGQIVIMAQDTVMTWPVLSRWTERETYSWPGILWAAVATTILQRLPIPTPVFRDGPIVLTDPTAATTIRLPSQWMQMGTYSWPGILWAAAVTLILRHLPIPTPGFRYGLITIMAQETATTTPIPSQ